MNISPINFTGAYNRFIPKRTTFAFLSKNECDSCSFSRKPEYKENSKSPKYTLETRKAKSPYGRKDDLDNATNKVLSELDTRTNEFINIANEKSASAEKYKSAVLSARRKDKNVIISKKIDGTTHVVINNENNTIFASIQKNGAVAQIKVYKDSDGQGNENEREVYTFDQTGKLGSYLYDSVDSIPTKLNIEYYDNRFCGKRIKKQKWGKEEEEFTVKYNEKNEISAAGIKEKTRVRNSIIETSLQKIFVNTMGDSTFALCKRVTDDSNGINLENFFKCISYK